MKIPNFTFEKKLWKKYRMVAGIDEVGRGAFAGPVTAGCVVFSKTQALKEIPIKIDDSKKLRPRQREKASVWIKANALAWGVGSASPAEINRLGLSKASQMAFRRAITKCQTRIDFLLIDAFYIPYVRGLRRKNQKPIINGDEKSISIAAAAIIAKVERDKLMQKLRREPKYKKYGWGRNKGYGTREHQLAIKKYGLTRLHRREFVKSLFSSQAQSRA